MALRRVWTANISGSGAPGVKSWFSTETDINNRLGAHTKIDMARTTGPASLPVLSNYGAAYKWLALDLNHRPALIYQPMIMEVGGTNGLPQNLNIRNAKLGIKIALGRDLFVPQRMQILPHAQWENPRSYMRLGSYHNAVFVNDTTLDVALGAPAPKNRSANGYQIPAFSSYITHWFDYTAADMFDLGARPDRLFNGLYQPIEDKDALFDCKLLNMLIMFVIPDAGNVKVDAPDWNWMGDVIPPTIQPPDTRDSPGTESIWYVAALELFVDDTLNSHGAVSGVLTP